MTTEKAEPNNGQAGAQGPPLTDEESRRMAVLSAFGTAEALSSLWALAEDVPNLEHAVNQAKLSVTMAKEGVELREAELSFEVKGEAKNAEERKNALEMAKPQDETYVNRLKALQEAEAKLQEAERVAQVARHRERYWHGFLATRQAQIRYLAG